MGIKGILMFFILASLSVTLCAPLSVLAQGNTYYVDPSGSDVNDGSSVAPWRTIQHAVENVAPGDTILVRSGTYVGCRIQSSGTSSHWITLKTEAGAHVIVNAPGPENTHNSNIEIETWDGVGTVAYWIIEGLEVSQAPSWGIDIRGNEDHHSHNITVRGNTVHHNGIASGKTGIFLAFVDYGLIENNESYSNGEHGIYYSNSGDYPTIRDNLLHHNAGCGLHMNGDAEMGGDGIISYGIVEGNTIYENGTLGGSGINFDGVMDTVVRNNLLYNNHAGGIAIFQENGGICSQNIRILNNTIVMASDGRWAVNIAQTGCINNKVFNNILYSYHNWRGSIQIPTPSLAGFESDYNVVLDRFSIDSGNNRISLTGWQALGYDIHSFIALPADLFEDVAGDDYHLSAGSLAIDNGVALSDVNDDIDGDLRPQGSRYDIGADEYASGGSYDEIIGTWSSGIWYWNLAAGTWTKMYSDVPSGPIAAGDVTGDGRADVVSCWGSGLWYQNGATNGWYKVSHKAPNRVACGDITGDGRDEIIGCGGTWKPGIYYINLRYGTWHKPYHWTPGGEIAVGDVTGDGRADVVSCWGSGLWYQNGATNGWTKVSSTAPGKVACGDVT